MLNIFVRQKGFFLGFLEVDGGCQSVAVREPFYRLFLSVVDKACKICCCINNIRT